MFGITGIVALDGLFRRSGICRRQYKRFKFPYSNHFSASKECLHAADSGESSTEPGRRWLCP